MSYYRVIRGFKAAYRKDSGEYAYHIEEQNRLFHHANFLVQDFGFSSILHGGEVQLFLPQHIPHFLARAAHYLFLLLLLALLDQFAKLPGDKRLSPMGLSSKLPSTTAVIC